VTAQSPDIGWIGKALMEMSEILQKKNDDYRITGEFSNFYFAADIAGLPVEKVILAQIGIKIGRLHGLMQPEKDPNWESIEDTIKDLHGYAAILHAHRLSMEIPRA